MFIIGVLSLSYIAFELYKKVFKANIKFGEDIEETFGLRAAPQILPLLSNYNLLLDTNSFRWVAEKKNYINNIKGGKYFIHRDMNNNELINLLRSGRQSPVKVTFNNLRSLHEVSAKLSTFLESDSLEIVNAFLDKDFLKENGFNKNNIISIFLPNTYEFYWNTSANKLRDRMLKEYKNFWNKLN